MAPDSTSIPIETLLAETQWVRALAGSLVRDDAAADELVQETYRAALSSPPRAGVPVRAWLRVVVRNFARRSWRENLRRTTREHAVVSPERDPWPGPEELAARLESQREVARLVAGLAEPFRSTVLLRYWEGLSSAEIARRQKMHPGTVRWRLKRALDDLRSRLDAEHDGDRSSWVALLLPIASSPPRPAVTAGGPVVTAAAVVGGTLAVKKIAIAALSLGFLAVGLHFTGWFGAGVSPGGPDRPVEGMPAPAPRVADAGGDEAVEKSSRRSGDASAAKEVEQAAPAVIRVRFVDGEGRPIDGVVVQPGGVRPPVRSGPDGVAVVPVALRSEETWARLEVSRTGYADRELTVAIRRGEISPLGEVVLSPGGAVSGLMIGPDGSPAEGASVRLAKPTGPLDLLSGRLVDGPVTEYRTETAADGSFRIEGVPVGFWRVWAGGNGLRWTATDPVEVRSDREVEGVTLHPAPGERNEGFSILVMDPEGRPLPRARIAYQLQTSEGRFLAGGTGSADEEGRIRFRQAAAATGDFTARDPEERYEETRVENCRAGSGEIVLRLRRGRPFTLFASDPDDAPLPRFTVAFLEADADREVRSASGTDGQLAVIPPSVVFRIRVGADGFRSEVVGPFTRESVPSEVRVALRALPGIRGLVTAKGRPVAGARVLAHALADPRWYQEHNGFIVTIRPGAVGETVTGPDGTFALYPMRPDRLLLRVEVKGYAPAESAVLDYEPEAGCGDLVIGARPGGVLEGTVVSPGGGDPSGTIVGISRGDTYGRTVRVGADGKFRFEHLAPGPIEVVIREEEILPERNSSFGGGPARPVPFNCRIIEGETAVFDLELPGDPATLAGEFRIDGRAPHAWKAGLYRPGASLVAETETDVGTDGAFRLRALEGPWRLLVTSPGGMHESTVVVAELHLAGETGWECAYETGRLEFDRPADLDGETQLYHRFVTATSVLVLTPVNAGDDEVRVPVGKGEIVRFDLSVWSQPMLWPRLAEVEVKPVR